MATDEITPNLEEDILSEEIKTLISSLPLNTSRVGKLYNYQGCWYRPRIVQGILNFQRNFQPQGTDIILASFPKSGTTWLKALTISLLERSKNPSSLDDDDHPLLSNNPHTLVPFFELNLYQQSSSPDLANFSSSPRVFSTHMPLHTLQVPLKDSPCKIVYLYRNAKDVLASLYHFINFNKEVYSGSKREILDGVDNYSFEVMFESFCNGVILYAPFWEHVLSYWRGSLADPNHVLFMRYEELKTEPQAQLKRLAEFLDCPFTKEEQESGYVDKILQLCSLSNLSRLEINKTGKTNIGVGFKSYFRKGEVGDFKNHMSLEMENKIDMILEEKFHGSGFKF